MELTFFDHADIYAGGEAETVFGNALTPQLREKMVIQTKCAIRPGICYDFSKEYILNSVDGSLKRLKNRLCRYITSSSSRCVDGAGRGSRSI